MEFIDRITQLIPIERIYSRVIEAEGTSFTALTILMPTAATMHMMEANILVRMAMSNYPDYRFGIFYVHEVKKALSHGSMVFYRSCRERYLVYPPEAPAALAPDVLRAKDVLKKAKSNFELEWKTLKKYRKIFHDYLSKGKFIYAAFMLHRMTELGFRCMEVLLIGREKTSHSIRNHQRLLENYDPEMAKLFNEGLEEDLTLLLLLDEAFRSVRYDEDFRITKDQLLCILNKVDVLENRVLQLYDSSMERFKVEMEWEEAKAAELPGAIDPALLDDGFGAGFGGFGSGGSGTVGAGTAGSNTIGSATTGSGLKENPVDKIIAKISALVPAIRIYRLNLSVTSTYRVGLYTAAQELPVDIHFHLLVICDCPATPEVFNVQQLLNEDPTVPQKLTLFMHSVKEVQVALAHQNAFFHQLLRKGKLLYEKPGTTEGLLLPEFVEEKAEARRMLVWRSRFKSGESLISGAVLSEDGHGIARAAMLSQGMVQLCLAYMVHHIGYEPNQLTLRQLFAICRMIDPYIDEIFPSSRTEDRRLFYFLLEADRTLRYRISDGIDPTDQGILLRRCVEWLEGVKAQHGSEDPR